MTDPKIQPEEPQRTNPSPSQPPIEEPPQPATEYEKSVPHESQPSTAVSRFGEGGEGSYEGTRQYLEGYEEFARHVSPEEALEDAKHIDTDDPALREAEQRARTSASRVSVPSVP